jgi:hypothetical protein
MAHARANQALFHRVLDRIAGTAANYTSRPDGPLTARLSPGWFQGRWSLSIFCFTFRPDVCPNTLYQLQQVRRQWLDGHADADFPVYLVTVDPSCDTPQKLAAYLGIF